jgi:hypothetical protein
MHPTSSDASYDNHRRADRHATAAMLQQFSFWPIYYIDSMKPHLSLG